MVTQPGPKNSNWGGGEAISSHGYKLIKVERSHPLANRNGYAYAHRLEAEKMLGRPLRPGERVKFRDGDRRNLAPSNLVVRPKQSAAQKKTDKVARVAIRKRGVETVPGFAKESLLELFEGRCAYCGNPADTFDHVRPVVDGGQTVPGNIVPACTLCNSSKHKRNVWEWADATGRELRCETMELLVHWGHGEF